MDKKNLVEEIESIEKRIQNLCAMISNFKKESTHEQRDGQITEYKRTHPHYIHSPHVPISESLWGAMIVEHEAILRACAEIAQHKLTGYAQIQFVGFSWTLQFTKKEITEIIKSANENPSDNP